MKSAKEMFGELGFINLATDHEKEIRYFKKTDTEKMSVLFEIDLKRYYVSSTRWIPKDSESWITMNNNNSFRDEFDKYCATYGHWQLESYNFVDYDLHKAINKQCEELNWK